jgi:hypothetical protein
MQSPRSLRRSVAMTTTSLGARAYDACCIIYDAMVERSIPVAEAPRYVRRATPEGVERVYVGGLVAMFAEIGYTSTATYHARKHELVDMSCIQQVWRGGNNGSAWAILRPPTYDLWVRFVGKEFRPRDAEVWDSHERALENFFQSAPTLYRDLLKLAAKAGARNRSDFIGFLAKLPEPTIRSLSPLCLAFAVPGTVHTCMVAPLDPLAVRSHGGAWKRKRDHLAKLKLAEKSPLPR